MKIDINKKPNIIKDTLFFALLLPLIQGTQLYFLFDLFNPGLLIMPIVMGSITGYLVGFYKREVFLQIQELENTKNSLEHQVQEQTKELQAMLLLDPLTGLGNRLKLKETLDIELERLGSEYKYISILMMDIDYFKYYNDFYGHLQGDNVLKSLASFLQESIDESQNSVIRFGGEEFMVILPDCDTVALQKIAQQLVEGTAALNIEHKKSKIAQCVTISVGAYCAESIEDKSLFIKNADDALYRAKEQGRNRVTIYK